jgi:prevent-host-death family protein
MKKATFSVSEFKSESLGLLERVASTGETLVITKHGKPIAQVVPFAAPEAKPVPGTLRSLLIEENDLLTPFGAALWKAAEPE